MWKICSPPINVVDYNAVRAERLRNKIDKGLKVQAELHKQALKAKEDKLKHDKQKKRNQLFEMLELFYPRMY